MRRNPGLPLAFLMLLIGFIPVAVATTSTIGPFTFTKTNTSVFFFATPPDNGEATMDGVQLQPGDVVAAFVGKDSVNDLCIGAWEVTAPGAYGAMAVYGDDPTTGNKDGAYGGETVTFKVWQQSTDRVGYAVPQGPDATIWTSSGSVFNVGLAAVSGISADVNGVRKDVFEEGGPIYGQAVLGLNASTSYDVHVVNDRTDWQDGNTIPARTLGTTETFTTDANGDMPTGTLLYFEPVPGGYDIIVDVNANGIFDKVVDYLDDNANVGAHALSVILSSFSAHFSEGDKEITLLWRTQAEINHLGWYIYRRVGRDGDYLQMNERMVAGQAGTTFPRDYRFLDEAVEANREYSYYLEAVDLSGQQDASEVIRVWTLPLSPLGKLAVCWGRLKRGR